MTKRDEAKEDKKRIEEKEEKRKKRRKRRKNHPSGGNKRGADRRSHASLHSRLAVFKHSCRHFSSALSLKATTSPSRFPNHLFGGKASSILSTSYPAPFRAERSEEKSENRLEKDQCRESPLRA